MKACGKIVDVVYMKRDREVNIEESAMSVATRHRGTNPDAYADQLASSHSADDGG